MHDGPPEEQSILDVAPGRGAEGCTQQAALQDQAQQAGGIGLVAKAAQALQLAQGHSLSYWAQAPAKQQGSCQRQPRPWAAWHDVRAGSQCEVHGDRNHLNSAHLGCILPVMSKRVPD